MSTNAGENRYEWAIRTLQNKCKKSTEVIKKDEAEILIII